MNTELYLFRQNFNELEALYDRFPKRCGLSSTEFWSLYMIDKGYHTQKDICQKLCLSRQTVNSAIQNLLKKDLVELGISQENLRLKYINLTEKGYHFVEEKMSYLHSIEECAWNDMDEREKECLIKTMTKYKDLLSSYLNNE